MATVFKYVKALVPINLLNGALWMEEEDISRIPLEVFNLSEIQNAIAASELVEVDPNDLPADVVSPALKLRGEWDPSNGQLPQFRRIGDTFLVNSNGVAPYEMLTPGMRVLFRTLNAFEIIGSGEGAVAPVVWEYKNSNFTVEPGGRYIVDTSSSVVTGTLPDTLSPSFFIEIKDSNLNGTAGFGAPNSFFLARGALATYTLMGDTAPFEVDIPSPILSFAYDSTNNNVVI